MAQLPRSNQKTNRLFACSGRVASTPSPRAALSELPSLNFPNLSLGHEITTDVFELQPREGGLSRAAANALAIALREALARRLGIEADEMGFAVANWRNVLGGDAVSLYLFDRAAGGAGFATLFEDHIRDVIEEAGRILDCKTPGCEDACAACVLVSDAPRGADALDRSAALVFLRQHLNFPQNLVLEDRFVSDAQLSLMPGDEIARRLVNQQGVAVTLFVPQHAEMMSLSEWPIAQQFLNWAETGHPVTVAIPAEAMRIWSAAEKLVLRDFALHHHIGLAGGNSPTFANGASALAAVGSGTGAYTVWATRDPGAALPGPLWSVPGAHPIVRGLAGLPDALLPMDPAELLPPPGAYFLEIDAELDCPSLDFGKKATALLMQALTQIGAGHQKISSISYSDSYVTSPLVAGLLVDTVAALATSVGGIGTLSITTRPPRSNERFTAPSLINHDWLEPGIQRTVIEAYGKLRGLATSVKQIDAVPHGRFLEVRFSEPHHVLAVADPGVRCRILRYSRHL